MPPLASVTHDLSVPVRVTDLRMIGSMAYQTIEFKKKDNTATITLNRPDKRNAINEYMGDDLVDCITRCGEDPNIKAIILTGKGSAFCSGGDLDAEEFFSDSPQLRIKKLLNRALPVFNEIRKIAKPVIAAVNGPAIGGGFALALACDLIVAGRSSNFSSHYVLLAMSPDAGITYLLPRLLGDKRAAWLMFTGDSIDAQSAFEMGFVNKVVDDTKLLNEAEAMARRLSHSATEAIARIKELINLSWYGGIETQMEYEKQSMARLALTDDVKEAISAFHEKRNPDFKGS